MLSSVSVRAAGFCARSTPHRSFQKRRLVTRAEAGEQPGEKITQWLKTPFDFAAFGPRVTAGFLVAAPEKLEQLQTDLLKLSDLLQDPRPFESKQEIMVKEVEDRISKYLERGAMVEEDVLDSLRLVLPSELIELIPRPDALQRSAPAPAPSPPISEPPSVIYTSESVTVEQTNAAVSGVEEGIQDLEESMAALRSNESAARENMLKLNLQEARDRLGYLLDETQTNGVETEQSTMRAREIMSEADSLL